MDFFTSLIVAVTCLMAAFVQGIRAIGGRSAPHGVMAVLILVIMVIFAVAVFGVWQPVDMRSPLRIALSFLMLNIYIMHRHEARGYIKQWGRKTHGR